MLEIQQKKEKNNVLLVPKEVMMVIAVLHAASHEAYLVGGCVRDLLMGVKPKDYDVTTNATPEQIIALFPKTFYENTYGTVGVVTCGEDLDTICTDETVKIIEVTPYRLETTYSDNRHPDVPATTRSHRRDRATTPHRRVSAARTAPAHGR